MMRTADGLWIFLRTCLSSTTKTEVCCQYEPNEAQKALIRNNFPPQIAEQMCNAIDGQERAEHFQRLLREYREWMQNQQRQQEAVQRFLREYYH